MLLIYLVQSYDMSSTLTYFMSVLYLFGTLILELDLYTQSSYVFHIKTTIFQVLVCVSSKKFFLFGISSLTIRVLVPIPNKVYPTTSTRDLHIPRRT